MSPVLSGYFFRIQLFWSTLVLLILLVVYITIDLVELSSFLSVDLLTLFRVYRYRMPAVLSHILPISVVLGMLLSFSRLWQSGEWHVMQQIGVSPMRLSLWMMALPLIAMLLHLFLLHYFAPVSVRQFESMTNQSVFSSSRVFREGDRIVIRASGDADEVMVLDRSDGVLERLRVLDSVSGAIDAEWNRSLGWQESAALSRMDVPETLRVPEVSLSGIVGGGLTTLALRRLADRMDGSGQQSDGIRAEIGVRYLLSVSCALIPLFALLSAIGFRLHRAGSLAVLGIGICALFWIQVSAAMMLVRSGTVTDPQIVIGILGFWILLVGAWSYRAATSW